MIHRKRYDALFIAIGILALAAGILLILLEVGSYRRAGQVSYFWIAVAILAGGLGLYDIIQRRGS